MPYQKAPYYILVEIDEGSIEAVHLIVKNSKTNRGNCLTFPCCNINLDDVIYQDHEEEGYNGKKEIKRIVIFEKMEGLNRLKRVPLHFSDNKYQSIGHNKYEPVSYIFDDLLKYFPSPIVKTKDVNPTFSYIEEKKFSKKKSGHKWERESTSSSIEDDIKWERQPIIERSGTGFTPSPFRKDKIDVSSTEYINNKIFSTISKLSEQNIDKMIHIILNFDLSNSIDYLIDQIIDKIKITKDDLTRRACATFTAHLNENIDDFGSLFFIKLKNVIKEIEAFLSKKEWNIVKTDELISNLEKSYSNLDNIIQLMNLDNKTDAVIIDDIKAWIKKNVNSTDLYYKIKEEKNQRDVENKNDIIRMLLFIPELYLIDVLDLVHIKKIIDYFIKQDDNEYIKAVVQVVTSIGHKLLIDDKNYLDKNVICRLNKKHIDDNKTRFNLYDLIDLRKRNFKPKNSVKSDQYRIRSSSATPKLGSVSFKKIESMDSMDSLIDDDMKGFSPICSDDSKIKKDTFDISNFECLDDIKNWDNFIDKSFTSSNFDDLKTFISKIGKNEFLSILFNKLLYSANETIIRVINFLKKIDYINFDDVIKVLINIFENTKEFVWTDYSSVIILTTSYSDDDFSFENANLVARMIDLSGSDSIKERLFKKLNKEQKSKIVLCSLLNQLEFRNESMIKFNSYFKEEHQKLYQLICHLKVDENEEAYQIFDELKTKYQIDSYIIDELLRIKPSFYEDRLDYLVLIELSTKSSSWSSLLKSDKVKYVFTLDKYHNIKTEFFKNKQMIFSDIIQKNKFNQNNMVDLFCLSVKQKINNNFYINHFDSIQKYKKIIEDNIPQLNN